MQEIPTAKPGPVIAGRQTYPGDIFLTRDGQHRIISSTAVTGQTTGVEVFDPESLTRSEYRLNIQSQLSGWTQVRQGIAKASILSGEDQTTAFVSRDLQTGAFICEAGTSALGTTSVDLDRSVQRQSASELVSELTDPRSHAVSTLFEGVEPEQVNVLTDELTQQIQSVVDTRLETVDHAVSTQQFWTAEVVPPAVTQDEYRTLGDRVVAPGDKIVKVPNGGGTDLLDLPLSVLSDGTCEVVIRPEQSLEGEVGEERSSYQNNYRLFCLLTGTVEILSSEAFARRFDSEDQTATVGHLQLLGRDARVKPLENETFSTHVYRYQKPYETVYILAADRQETTEPRLEHPLTLPTVSYDSFTDIQDALREHSAEPLSLDTWVDSREQLAKNYSRLADRIGDIYSRRFGSN